MSQLSVMSPPAPPGSRSGNLLIIDDSIDNVRLLVQILAVEGYRVRVATSGALGLDMVQAAPPELILLDILMPGMDGFQVCRRLKADPQADAIPVIFLSALDDIADKVTAFALGGADYVTKPFQAPEVLARVHAQLARVRAEQVLRESLATYRQLAEASFEGLLLHQNGIIIEVNSRLTDLLGYSAKALIGRPIANYLPLVFLDSPVPGSEFQVRRSDGTMLAIEVLRRSFTYQGRQIEVVAMRDLTERNRLFAEVQRLAETDPLTGVFNRRQLFALGQHALLRAKHTAMPLSVVLLDIDHFKQVNDRAGHSAGDSVLVTLAQTCHTVLRTEDSFFRYGGEEFVALLPNTPLDQAVQIAERLRVALAACPIAAPEPFCVTVSFGVAALSPDCQELEPLLGRADAALYAAKRRGRNQVVGWGWDFRP